MKWSYNKLSGMFVLLATKQWSMKGKWGAVSEGTPHAINVMRQI